MNPAPPDPGDEGGLDDPSASGHLDLAVVDDDGALTVTFYGTKRYEIESLTSDRYDVTSPAVLPLAGTKFR